MRKVSSFLAHLFPVAHLTFRGGKGGGEMEERKNPALRRLVKKKLPTKESACFFTFLLLSRISPPLDLHPTSAWNISACWVRLQAEMRCSLNKAIPCPLTGTCRYASPDDLFFSSLRHNEYACIWVCSTWEEGSVCTSVCVCVIMYALKHMCVSLEILAVGAERQ